MLFPTGLMPKLASHDRRFRHRALHALARPGALAGADLDADRPQSAAALGNIAPNIGSIVAIEKDKERTPDQVFPTFLALNSGGGVGGAICPAVYAPFKVTPATAGIGNTTNPDGAIAPSTPAGSCCTRSTTTCA